MSYNDAGLRRSTDNQSAERRCIVVVVEDDPAVGEALCETLGLHGFETKLAPTGAAALAHAPGSDLILLDLGLPDLDGLEVCRRLREVSAVPIIAVSARSEEVDRVLGLTLGADDYVVKPYGQRELLARIEAVLRRTQSRMLHDQPVGGLPMTHPRTAPGGERQGQLSAATSAPGTGAAQKIGRVLFDPRSHQVWVDGEPIALTRKEFAILTLLAREPGNLVRRDVLVNEVWGSPWNGPMRTIDVHVSSLRQKLGIADFITTVRGVGFRINVDHEI